MNEIRLAQRLFWQGIFVILCGLFMFVRLLPLDSVVGAFPGPDLMLCGAFCWVIRRPDLLPVWLIAPVFLLADMLLMHPPGLWTALVVLATEALRRRHRRARGWSFTMELMVVGLLSTGMVCAQWLALTVLLVPQPALLSQLAQVPVTLIAYPAVVLLSHVAFGIRKRPAPEGFGKGAQA